MLCRETDISKKCISRYTKNFYFFWIVHSPEQTPHLRVFSSGIYFSAESTEVNIDKVSCLKTQHIDTAED